MGNVDLIAFIKWLWAALPPIMWKMWGIIDARFKQVEDDGKDVKEQLSNMKSSIEVLVERSGNQEKSQDTLRGELRDMSVKFDKLYELLMTKK